MDVFDCEAMNTTLSVKICGEEYNYARSAAAECFSSAAMMEDLLSMYREGSDVAMINSSAVGECVKVTGTTMDCLAAAFAVSAASRGTVDVGMGEFFLTAKGVAPRGFVPKRGIFEMDPEDFYVRKREEGMIDLGAVGKGFAVDELAAKLAEEWEIKNAFLSFGGSSLYAFGKPDDADVWSISIDGNEKSIPISGVAVGASGTAVQGAHIVDPRTGKAAESAPYLAWAFGDSAAMCDGLSTAFMLLSTKEISEICAKFGVRGARKISEKSKVEYFGDWSNAPR